MNRFVVFILCCFASLHGVSQVPVAYWAFDNTANDQSGNHNDGIIHGNITLAMDRFGNPCGAYHFDGISSYIEVASSPSLESPSSAFTITAWYRFDNSKTNQWLTAICKGRSNTELADNPQYRLQVQQNTMNVLNTCSPAVPTGSSTVSINTDFTECDMNFQDHLFETGKWNFYALVYDGQRVVTYMNDKKVFEFVYSGTLSKNNSPVFIGYDEPGNTEYFEGSLDDIRVYNSAITEQEVHNLYASTGTANWTKEEFEITAPKNKVVDLAAKSCSAIVNFDAPQLINSCSNVSIRQVAGLTPGSNFNSGKHLISYEAVSASGYDQHYSFYIIVRDISPPLLKMPVDTVITVKNGLAGINYNYKNPTATDNCGVKSVNILSGKASNEFFGMGRHVIRYRATDINGNTTENQFVVQIKEEKVKPVKPVIIVPVKVDSVPVKADSTMIDTAYVENKTEDTVSKKPVMVSIPIENPKVQPPPVDSALLEIKDRIKEEQKFLEADNAILIAKLYDNGVNDNDTVTILLNQRILLWKQKVTGQGQEFTITLDTTIDNELVMYAENLGQIPPNTALLIIFDGGKRYEINLLSTLSTNGTIRIRKKKK